MTRNIKEYVVLTLKGMGMGAADVVPGVSGGTIAFIVGIYEELINSIKSVDFKTLKLFFTLKWGSFWKSINGNFLFSVLFGILISIFSLAKLITFLLDNYPVLVWAFFFGLVIASTYFVSKRIEIWDWKRWLSFIIGALMAYYITGCNSVANSRDTSIYFPLWCYCHLCNDITRYFRKFYSAIIG